MKKILLLLTITNLIYMLITMVANQHNIFLSALGLPTIIAFVMLFLGIISLIFDEDGRGKKTISIWIIMLNLLPLLNMLSVFIFL